MGVIRALQPELRSMQEMRSSVGGIKGFAAKVPGIRLRPGQEPKILVTLFGGGPANVEGAILEPIVRIAADNGIAVFGVEDGFKGLLDGGRGVFLNPYFAHGLSRVGGGIIGTDRKNPTPKERKMVVDFQNEWEILCFNFNGGNDTGTTTNNVSKDGGLAIAGAKTVDNDIPITDTYGFITAYTNIGSFLNTYDNEAVTTNAISLAQIMGRNSGSLTLRSSQVGGVTRSYIGEEFTQKGLWQLSGAWQRGEEFARIILNDLADVVRIGGEIKTPSWIRSNIDQVDPSAVHLDPVALRDQMTGIIAQRRAEGRRDALITFAEGLAERLPFTVTHRDEHGHAAEGEVEIFGKKKTIEFDDHGNAKLGPLKIGDDINDHVRIATGKDNPKTGHFEKGKTIYNSFTYEARCVDVPNPTDVILANAIGRQIVTSAIEGRFGVMAGYKDGHGITIPLSDIPFDPETGKMVTKSVDLGGPEYFEAKSLEYFLHDHQGG